MCESPGLENGYGKISKVWGGRSQVLRLPGIGGSDYGARAPLPSMPRSAAMAIEQQLAEDYELLDKTTATSAMTGCRWCFYAYRALQGKEKQRV